MRSRLSAFALRLKADRAADMVRVRNRALPTSDAMTAKARRQLRKEREEAAYQERLAAERARRIREIKEFNDRRWPDDPSRYVGTVLEGREGKV